MIKIPPRKTTKKNTKGPAKKKTVAKPATLAQYRAAHKKIPGSVYKVREKATQTIRKTNYAPLGRPPTDPKARTIYNTSKRKSTPHGQAITARKAAAYMKRQEAEDKRNREYYRYLNQKDEYDQYRYSEGLKRGEYVLEDVDSELADMGYKDYDKNYRRKGSAKRLQAWEQMKRRKF